MSQNDEAIVELLERIVNWVPEELPKVGLHKPRYVGLKTKVKKMVAKLRAQPERNLWFVEDYLKKALNRWDIDGKYWVEQAIKELQAQPEAGEFTNKVRKMKFAISTGGISAPAIIDKLKEACDHLDRKDEKIKELEAEIDKMKNAIKDSTNIMTGLMQDHDSQAVPQTHIGHHILGRLSRQRKINKQILGEKTFKEIINGKT